MQWRVVPPEIFCTTVVRGWRLDASGFRSVLAGASTVQSTQQIAGQPV